MTPREELEALRAKKLARIAELEAKASGSSTPVPSAAPPAEEESNFFSDLAKGAKSNLDKTALGIKGLLPQAVQDWGDRLDAAAGSGGLTKETAVKTPESLGGQIGNVGTEIATMLAPGNALLKGGRVIGAALKGTSAAKAALPLALGLDVGGNAALSAATTPEDRSTAAAWGAGGAAGGRVLARTLGGPLRGSVSPQAQQLMDEKIFVTPGQALTGPDAGWIAKGIRKAEDSITSVPVLGDVIRNAQDATIKSFNVNRINEALAPIGAKVKNAGLDGLAEADAMVSKHYDKVLPEISVPIANANTAVLTAQLNARSIPLFDKNHETKLIQFITDRIEPLLSRTQPITGKVAKSIDEEIGKLAREYTASGPGNRQLGEAFGKLRSEWRGAMEGTTPEARQALKDADKAYAKLLPLQEAGNKTASGIFTPMQLARQREGLNMKPDPVTQAARQVLPLSVPDSGTAGRLIVGHALKPSGAGAATAATAGLMGMTPLALAAAGAGAMYTGPGLRAMTQGVHPIVKALRRSKAPYDPNNIEDIIRNLTARGTTTGFSPEE